MLLKNRPGRRRFCSASAAFLLCLAVLPAKAQMIADSGRCAPNPARLTALRQTQSGVFRALRLAETPLYLGNLPLRDAEGAPKHLADFSGKMLLVNLWGVWCPPCRAEIPDLAALQAKLSGENFAVLTVYDQASGKEKVQAFLRARNAENLPLYHDPDMALYGALKREGLARGLPVSLLVDAQSCLIASLNGGAPWASAEALAFINAAQK